MRNWYLQKLLLLFKVLSLLDVLKDLEFAMAEKKMWMIVIIQDFVFRSCLNLQRK